MFAAPIFLLIAMSQVWITTETGDIIVMVALLSGSLIEVSIQVSGQKHNATKNSPTYVVQVLCKYFFFFLSLVVQFFNKLPASPFFSNILEE